MITLDAILENIIVEILISISSLMVSIFLPKLIRKDKKAIVKYDPLSIAIFIESFLIFNLIANISFWGKFESNTFLILVSIIFGCLTYYIYNQQCPSCKKFIRAKKRIDSKVIKEFTRDWKYQPMKIWLYSNGNVWKKKSIGNEKTRTENWIIRQDFYECSFCGYKWDSGHYDVNLDKKTRPKHEEIRTDKRDPDQSY